jgi:hypothetical protein
MEEEIMTRLQERLDRIAAGNVVDFATYVSQLREQRARHPKHPKLFNPITLPLTPDKPVSLAITEVLNEGYEYTGTINVREGIYPSYFDTNMFNDAAMINSFFLIGYDGRPYRTTNLYYEFVLGDKDLPMSTWKYLYAPVSANSRALLKDKLPHVTYYNTSALTANKVYPREEYLYNRAASSFESYYSLDIADDFYHPYQPYFYFTGKVAQQSNGSLLFEYFDSLGLYGIKDDLYISTLRPINLDYPLGNTTSDEIVLDPCLIVGIPPNNSYLNMYGLSTGYRTTSKYDPLNSYILYEREDGTSFLKLEETEETNPYALQFYELAKAIDDPTNPGINISILSTNQAYDITQSSDLASINIGD